MSDRIIFDIVSPQYIFVADKKKQPDGRQTVSQLTFVGRMLKVLEPFFGDDFDFNNLVVAGGLVTGLMDRDFDTLYRESDIDIFIYGLPEDAVIAKLNQTINYLRRRFNDVLYVFNYSNTAIVTILVPGQRVIQLIGCSIRPIDSSPAGTFASPIDLIRRFDMTHCQIGFTPTDMRAIYTDEFAEAIDSRVTKVIVPDCQLYRLIKAWTRGYSVERSHKKTNIINRVNSSYAYASGYSQSIRDINKSKLVADIEEQNTLSCMDSNDVSDEYFRPIQKVLQDPNVIRLLSKNYVPSIAEAMSGDFDVIKKIKTHYSVENVLFAPLCEINRVDLVDRSNISFKILFNDSN